MPLLSRPASALRLVVLLVGGQTLVHLFLTVTAGHVGDPTGHRAPVAAHGPAHGGRPPGRLAAGPVRSDAGAAHAARRCRGHLVEDIAAHAPMMAVHLLAAVLVGLWLAVGERSLWTLVALATAGVPRLLTFARPAPPGSRPRAVPAARRTAPRPGWPAPSYDAGHRLSSLPPDGSTHPPHATGPCGPVARPCVLEETDDRRARARTGAHTRPAPPPRLRAVPRRLAVALLRRLPGGAGAAGPRDHRADLPVPLPARTAAARRPDAGRAAAGTIAQPYSGQLAAVENAFPDATIVSMTEPGGPDESTRFSLAMPDGSTRDAYVDPYGPTYLGSLNPDTTLSGYAVRLHGELMTGHVGDLVIELGACWAMVMALTGYYLFVKGRRARRRAKQKLRSRHGYVGLFVGLGLLMLIVSGLPWTGVWGTKVQELATERGTSMWSLDHGAISDPRRPSTSRCRTATPPTCRGGWASRRSRVSAGAGGPQRRERGHRGRGRRRRGAAAPDDRRAARARTTASTR